MVCRPKLGIAAFLPLAFALAGAAAAVPATSSLDDAVAALARGDGIAAEVLAGRALNAGVPRQDMAALMGEAKLLQGDLDEARQWLSPIQFSDETRARGFHVLGRIEMQEGDLPGAAAAFDRALEANAEDALLWVDIGRLRYQAGQHHLVSAAVARALAIDPAEPRALELQAQLVRDSQGVRAALPLFERALVRAPDDLGLLGEYAATLGEAGQHRALLRTARRMVEIDPRDPRAYYLQAVLAARAGLDDLARRLLAVTAGAYDETPAGQLLEGILELRTGNARLAIERFDLLSRAQPGNAIARLLLARALLANGEANEVAARLGSEAQRSDAAPYTLALAARAYEQLGRREEAAHYLDRADKPLFRSLSVLAADHVPASGAGLEVARIRQMYARGETGAAASLAAALRQQFPDSIDMEILSGDVALLTSNAAVALSTYQSAAAVRRDFSLVARMAAAHEALGRAEDALSLVASYLSGNPRSAEASAELGRMHAKRGDWNRAELFLAFAQEVGVPDPRLSAELAAVQEASRKGKPANAPSGTHQISKGPVTRTLSRLAAMVNRGPIGAVTD